MSIVVGQSFINFISGGSSLSNMYSSGSNIYLNTNSGNFYLMNNNSTLTNLICDSATISTYTPPFTVSNLSITTATTSTLRCSSSTLTNLTATNMTSSVLYANIISKGPIRSVTLSGSTLLYQMASPDIGFLFVYWANGAALLSYNWIAGINNAFLTVVVNTATSSPITFTINTGAAAILASGTNGTVVRVAQLKFV